MAAHPSLDYALLVAWSGRKVFRFDHTVMTRSADAPWLETRDIEFVEFQPGGLRALVFGGRMTPSGVTIGTVLEYRHELLIESELTDVSIPSFGAPPFVAPNDFNFLDASWRPGCDGGLLVGGKSNLSIDMGMVVTFELEGGVDCWD